MTEGMMGRGSDTRMYSPRSESEIMYRNNDGDGAYNPGDPKYEDMQREKKRKEKEKHEKKLRQRKHIKIRPGTLREVGEKEDEDERGDDSDKYDADRETHLQTGAAGNFGFLSSLAGGAKGPGVGRGELIATGEPMNAAWSELIKAKTKKQREKQNKKEARKKGRPSTGEFKKPKGGYSPKSATSRRAKALSRSLGGSKKTGLGRAHLAVEMSHRGLKTKQPMRLEDPRKYASFMARQGAMAQQGQVRTPASPTPASVVGFSGRVPKPKLKPMRPPPIQPPRIAGAPHLAMGGGASGMPAPPPPMPVMTSEDIFIGSELQKRRGGFDWATVQELRQLLNRTRRILREKESKKKGYGNPDTSGAGSNLPKHPSNAPKSTNRNEGATEDAKTDPRHFGIDTVGHDVGRGGATP